MTPMGRYRMSFIATLLGMSSLLAAILEVLLDVGCEMWGFIPCISLAFIYRSSLIASRKRIAGNRHYPS